MTICLLITTFSRVLLKISTEKKNNLAAESKKMGQELSSCVACFYEPSMDTIDSESMYHISLTWTRDVNFFLCDTCLTEYMISQGRSLAMNYTFNSMVTVHFHQVQDE